MAGNVIGERARRVAIIEQMTPTNVTRPSLPPLASLGARTSSDPVTVTSPSSRRRPLFALAAAVLLGIVVTVVIAMAQGRYAPRSIASAAPASSSAHGATAAPPPPVVAEPAAAADPTPVAAAPAAPAPPPPAPAQTARPSAGAQGAPHKHASGGEFDHVMDSRK
jgi:hypothetical protein